MWDGGQPYLRASASRKALLCRVKPNPVSGGDVNQFEAPFSVARSTALRRVSLSIGFMAEASDCSVRRRVVLLVDGFFDGELFGPALRGV